MTIEDKSNLENLPANRPVAAKDERAAELYATEACTIAEQTDRLFAGLLVAEWIAAIALAFLVSPRAWTGGSSATHPHVWIALLEGGAVAAPTAALALRRPGRELTRHVVAVAQMLMGALLIHLSGGRIETHFHVFGSLAFLAFYRDWRVLVTASLVVVTDHLGRGIFAPQSIFGVATIDPLRWIEHAGWVVFEDVFLIASCVRGRREMHATASRQARVEAQSERELEYLAAVREGSAAEAANRAKSDFLANMSHEIRTPMTAVLGYADILLDPTTTPDERLDHVQTIRRNGEHLLSLLNDILDLSKIEAGKMSVERLACSPSGIVVDVASLMRVRASEKNLAFEVEYLTPMPETIQSDPTRLRQIVMNLVSNAIKFTSTGRVRILARCDGADGPRPTLTIEVADTGIGLSRDQLGRLFQPFAQADTSTTRKFGGSGLGLAICRSFAQMLGGDIAVESLVDRGSSFLVTVETGPLAGVRMIEGLTEASIPEMSAAETALTASEPAPQIPEDCTVLLAEDGLDNQILIAMQLRKAGVNVTIVENGRLALDRAMAAMAAGTPFDVILMDMQMPELDGYGATARLRERGYKAPIVALTAHAMAGDRERCLAAGCTDYLSKPINRARLIRTVADYANRRSAGPSSLHVRGTASVAPKPANSAVLVSELADDEDMLELVERFVADLPGRSKAIREALRAGETDQLKRLAHQLKGAGGGYGFTPITVAAASVELAIQRRAPLPEIEQLVDELGSLCVRARAVPARLEQVA